MGSVGTASEYEGDVKDAPDWMLFGNLECRAIFDLAQDKDKFHRVCGRNMGTCTRSGHSVKAKAKVGYYRTVAARKYVDGIEFTYLNKEAYETKEERRKSKGTEELKDAVAFLHGSSPSEDLAYEEVAEQEERKSREPDLLGKSEEGEKKVTPMKIGPEGTTLENKLLASPIMRDIAKVGKTEAGMFGLMDRLAEAVVESTERIKTLETKHYPAKRASEPDSTSEQLAKMTAMMGRMMDRMEDLEDRKKVSHYVKVEPNAVTPSKETTKHCF
jgi:hypothetical protein